MNVLSVQSAVAYGHVGNGAAVLPLQLLGHEVWALDTVRFSNHPGHGGFRGRVVPAAEVADLAEGLAALGLLARADALLSGYLGEAATGDVVADLAIRIKAARPGALYLCDPVMGDVGADGAGRLFVRDGVPAVLRDRLLPLADILTPNQYELGLLADAPAGTLAEAIAAARALCRRGPGLVVVTGFADADTPADAIDTVAVTPDHAWRVRAPRLGRRFDGAGDCFAALLLGRLLNGEPPRRAVASAVSSLQPILEATGDARDLALVAARGAVTRLPRRFRTERLRG